MHTHGLNLTASKPFPAVLVKNNELAIEGLEPGQAIHPNRSHNGGGYSQPPLSILPLPCPAVPVMVCVSELMVLVVVWVWVAGTVSSDTNWTVLGAVTGVLVSWQPLCL